MHAEDERWLLEQLAASVRGQDYSCRGIQPLFPLFIYFQPRSPSAFPFPSQVIFQLGHTEVSNVCFFYFLDLSLVIFKQHLFQNFLDSNEFNAFLVPDAGDKLETGLHPYSLLGMSLLWKPLGGNDK